jgi:phage terminase large subunit-like protein
VQRVVVAVDPAASVKETADEVGIITMITDQRGHGYVVADDSRRGMPGEWSRTVVQAARRWDGKNNAGIVVLVPFILVFVGAKMKRGTIRID